ncbi:hypothetical protein N7456_001031 [Penicillium angulare]|uniref:Zn(2)-C6 fungal-type domain-containing protein n=1 Tax=Penicillium angulare TaxID=116970 RepID=A0A9W9GD53_9EURO|nr:hypothetical protein N7456_001031 [Penicillium angulare]
MNVRRAHLKSKLGCTRCKEQHVKCDEGRPSCGYCTRHGVPCIRKPAEPSSAAQLAPRVSRDGHHRNSVKKSLPAVASRTFHSIQPSRVATPNIEAAIPTQSLEIWKVELLHHWILNVAKTFEVSPRFQELWQDDAVKVALHHEFLLHIILMLSALHLGLTKSPLFSEIHHHFILSGCSHATARLQAETNNISATNVRAVDAFPFLMSLYALSMPLLDQTQKDGETILDEMVHILVLIQGNKVVREQTNPWTEHHNLEPWAANYDILDEPDSTVAAFDSDQVVRELQPWIDASDDGSRVQGINSHALQMLQYAQKHNLKTNLKPLMWPNLVDQEYLCLLRLRNPLALVILAHYAIILGQCSSRWWCLDWGIRLVRAVERALPAKFKTCIAYPLEKLCLGPNGSQPEV